MPEFRVNQVIKCVSFADDHNIVRQGWRLGDLAILRVCYSNSNIGVTRVRDGYKNSYDPDCFAPISFVVGDRVRIVGFGPNNWRYKWSSRERVFVEEIGTVGQLVNVSPYSIRVATVLRGDGIGAIVQDRSVGTGGSFQFDPQPPIPELIPDQPGVEFNTSFWRNLWCQHPRELPVSRADVIRSWVAGRARVSVESQEVLSVEPDLPEPKKTKYDADY